MGLIVKLTYLKTKVKINISFNMNNGVKSTKLIKKPVYEGIPKRGAFSSGIEPVPAPEGLE